MHADSQIPHVVVTKCTICDQNQQQNIPESNNMRQSDYHKLEEQRQDLWKQNINIKEQSKAIRMTSYGQSIFVKIIQASSDEQVEFLSDLFERRKKIVEFENETILNSLEIMRIEEKILRIEAPFYTFQIPKKIPSVLIPKPQQGALKAPGQQKLIDIQTSSSPRILTNHYSEQSEGVKEVVTQDELEQTFTPAPESVRFAWGPKPDQLDNILRALVAKLIVSPNDMFFSVHNILVRSDRPCVQVNLTSTVGMSFIFRKELIGVQDLREIFELLVPQILEGDMFGKHMSIQCKIRALAFWLLCYLSGQEHLSFMPELCSKRDVQNVRFELLPQRRIKFMQFFAGQAWRMVCQKNLQAQRYEHFLIQVLGREKYMTWPEVAEKVIRPFSIPRPGVPSPVSIKDVAEILYQRQTQQNLKALQIVGLDDPHMYLLMQLSPNGDCSSLLGYDIDSLIQDKPLTTNWSGFVTQFRKFISKAITILPTCGQSSVSLDDLYTLLSRVASVEEGRLKSKAVRFQNPHDFTLRKFMRI